MAYTPRALIVRTRAVGPGDPLHDLPLLDVLPDTAPMSWVRGGDGIVAWGVSARVDTAGGERFQDADTQWQKLCTGMDVDDEVGLPGTGPVAFASLAFDAAPGHSVLVVPRVVVGSRDGVRWVTTISEPGEPVPTVTPPSAPVRRPGTIRYSDGTLSAAGYRQAVAEAVRRMRRSDSVSKVVLAHDLLASTTAPLDERFLLRNLTRRYPGCWTFAVDGLLGATPELLLRRDGNQVRSRVLAGTTWPSDGADSDELSARLLASRKDRGEHAYAVESLADRLRSFCDDLTVPRSPEVLRLRNVMHLTSDVYGHLDPSYAANGEATLLRLAEAVHPTAAVGGTPTGTAVRLIGELERMDRERYAGPVGWLDGDGNGEFGIALRCAQTDSARAGSAPAETAEDVSGGDADSGRPGAAVGSRVRLFAGCGIVADSDPDTEVAEAEAKLIPIREALEGVI